MLATIIPAGYENFFAEVGILVENEETFSPPSIDTLDHTKIVRIAQEEWIKCNYAESREKIRSEPKAQRRQENFEYRKSGFTHICITDPNIEDLFKKISETGGKQRSKLWEVVTGYEVIFCEDPFGNIIELLSNGVERTITTFAGTGSRIRIYSSVWRRC